MTRYACIENAHEKREIILLKAFPCSWSRCSFCDYIHDNSEDEAAMNVANRAVIAKVTGQYGVLQVINSGSCFEIPQESLQLIKDTVDRLNIRKLYFEAWWGYRHRLDEMRNYFGVPIIFITGIETFDDHFRNQVLKKGIVYSSVEEVSCYFQSVCLMIGIKGQTREMISSDIKILLDNFAYGTINLYVNNTTEIEADEELQKWFKREYAWLKDRAGIDVLFENTDFGVGAPDLA
ncbi:MAG: radical SAM protein [Candidatus Riflebacteria bacterium HGW-Riflebacteria-1]|nr:MAG: radical SAM protein [Candidatus Riflebacteria bacterium HGW-Riflebacteria-1]